MMRRLAGCLALVLVCSAAATAQEAYSTVESPGEATVYGLPTYVEFFVERVFEADSLEAAMQQAEPFADSLRGALTAAELQPSEMNALSPIIPDATAKTVKVSINLQFSVGSLGGPDTANQRFATLCHEMAEAATKLQASLRGPRLDTTDPEALVRNAVSEAIANAYPAAEASAAVLGVPILAVDKVKVLETTWNTPNRYWENEPSLRQIACTAKVNVTYALSVGAATP